MGVVNRLLSPRPMARRSGQMSLSDLDQMMDMQLRNGRSATGRHIDADTALRVAAVYACVRILAETLASLPLRVYERLDNGGKRPAPEHPLYRLLHDRPNDEMTSFELRETLVAHVALRGNAYAEILRDPYTSDPIALWPLRPDRMEISRVGAELVYQYRLADGTSKWFSQEQILHLRGLGSNGIVGYSPIEMAREAIGLGLAAEEFGARFFSNGARPGTVLQHPGALSDEAHKRLRESWESRHMGLSNAQRVAILEEGMTIATIGVAPDDAQFLETRKFQVTEIARLFRIPPHLIGDLDRATFSNIEHQGLEFVMHTVRPWAERIEQRMETSLLSINDRARYFIEHVVDGLLRGDIQSRYAAYATGRQWGWLSVNDIRGLENLNPVENGDIYLQPMNMVEAEAPTAATSVTNAVQTEDEARSVRAWDVGERQRMAQTFRDPLTDIATRLVNREINDVRNQARKRLRSHANAKTRDVSHDFGRWLREYYVEFRGVIDAYTASLLAALTALASEDVAREIGRTWPEQRQQEWLDNYRRSRAAIWADRHRDELMAAIVAAQAAGEDVLAAVEARIAMWPDDAPQWGNDQAVRIVNAVATSIYAHFGVRMVWRSFDASCPWCQQMDGKVVSGGDVFMAANSSLLHEGLTFQISHDVRHAPLHDGCDCMVVAA